MKLSKQQLMDILGVKKAGLKSIENRQQLKERLKEKGYEFKDKIKEGRNIYYIAEQTNTNKEVYNNMVKYIFNTTKEEQFTDYFLYRIMNLHRPITKNIIADKTNLNRKTITKLDNKMTEHNILSKDGYFYVCATYIDNKPTYTLTCKEEYNSYLKCSRSVKKKQKVLQRFKNGEIDFDMCQLLLDGIILNQKVIENKFVYRVSKFLLIENNDLIKDMFELIEQIYIDKNIIDYCVDWLESDNIKRLQDGTN